MANTTDLHGAVPLSILTGQVVVVSTEDEALIAEELNHSAMGKHPAGGWVASVAPIFGFGEGQAG